MTDRSERGIHKLPGGCRCQYCLIFRGESVTLRAWLDDWAPRAPRTTPAGWHYRNAEHFVHEHGQAFELESLTLEERAYVRACVRRARLRPVMGQCYRNARRTLVLGDVDGRLTYVEGFVGGKAIHHGWLLLDGRKVVDVTLAARDVGLTVLVPPSLRCLGGPPEPKRDEYFGVPIPLDVVLARWTGRLALVESAPWYRPPLLRTPWRAVPTATPAPHATPMQAPTRRDAIRQLGLWANAE